MSQRRAPRANRSGATRLDVASGAVFDDAAAGARTEGEGAGVGTGGAGTGGGTEEQAKAVCLRLLTVRARSRAELARRLAAKGFGEQVTTRALDRLTEVGLIDDATFAEQWVRSRHTVAGKGKQVLAAELRRHGVASEDAGPALAAVTAEDELARARELVRRRLRTLPSDLGTERTLSRLVGMLARRGYGQATALAAVRAELNDQAALPTDNAPELEQPPD